MWALFLWLVGWSVCRLDRSLITDNRDIDLLAGRSVGLGDKLMESPGFILPSSISVNGPDVEKESDLHFFV